MKSPTHQLLELSEELEKRAETGYEVSKETCASLYGCPLKWLYPLQNDDDDQPLPQQDVEFIVHARNTMKAKDEMIRVMYEALESAYKLCLCTESTKGFDYGEEHSRLKKAEGAGKRWLRPRECIDKALRICDELAKEILEKVK